MKKTIALAASALALAAITSVAARADDTSQQQIQTLLANQAASIVSIKVVIKTQVKMSGQAQDSESRADLVGTVVTPDGLIMVSNAPFDSKNLGEMLGMPDNAGFDMKMTPTDFKVVIGNEEKQYSAYLAATDPNRGLAFIKVQDLGDRKLQPADFTSTTTPTEGERVYVVNRLGKGYDYAPYLQAGDVYGEIDKPQKAWIIGDNLDVGLPVFSPAGEALGVMTTVRSGVTEPPSSSGMGLGMIMRMATGGGGAAMSNTFLVPASVISGVITLAKQQAAAKPAPPMSTTPAKPTKPTAPTPVPTAPK